MPEELTPGTIQDYSQRLLGMGVNLLKPRIIGRIQEYSDKDPLIVARETIQLLFIGRANRLMGIDYIPRFNPYTGEEIFYEEHRNDPPTTQEIDAATRLTAQRIAVTSYVLEGRFEELPDDIPESTLPELHRAIDSACQTLGLSTTQLPSPPCPTLLSLLKDLSTHEDRLEKAGNMGALIGALEDTGNIQREDAEDILEGYDILKAIQRRKGK